MENQQDVPRVYDCSYDRSFTTWSHRKGGKFRLKWFITFITCRILFLEKWRQLHKFSEICLTLEAMSFS